MWMNSSSSYIDPSDESSLLLDPTKAGISSSSEPESPKNSPLKSTPIPCISISIALSQSVAKSIYPSVKGNDTISYPGSYYF